MVKRFLKWLRFRWYKRWTKFNPNLHRRNIYSDMFKYDVLSPVEKEYFKIEEDSIYANGKTSRGWLGYSFINDKIHDDIEIKIFRIRT